MKGKSRGGAVAAALNKLLEAIRESLPGQAPVLRPIPVRRPAVPPRSD
jgi:hypothetical protein